jgi:hypothetical protein
LKHAQREQEQFSYPIWPNGLWFAYLPYRRIVSRHKLELLLLLIR